MPKSETQNAIVLRPFPGSRFSIFGADVEVQFQRGKEREVYQWLHDWLDAYVLPEVLAAERPAYDPNPEITRLKAQIESDQKARANHGISLSDQKLAALQTRPMGQTNHIQYDANAGQGIGQTHAKPFANMPRPGQQVVYGPNGPMTQDEINALEHKPIFAPTVPTEPSGEPDK